MTITPERLAELRAMPYTEYLTSQEWTTTRAVKLKDADYRCQLCNSTEGLQVHHRDYSRLGCEKMGDLHNLTRDCHKLFHERRTLTKSSSHSYSTACDWTVGSGSCATPRSPYSPEVRSILVSNRGKTCGNCGQKIRPGEPYVNAWPPAGHGQKPHCVTCCLFRRLSLDTDYSRVPIPVHCPY